MGFVHMVNWRVGAAKKGVTVGNIVYTTNLKRFVRNVKAEVCVYMVKLKRFVLTLHVAEAVVYVGTLNQEVHVKILIVLEEEAIVPTVKREAFALIRIAKEQPRYVLILYQEERAEILHVAVGKITVSTEHESINVKFPNVKQKVFVYMVNVKHVATILFVVTAKICALFVLPNTKRLVSIVTHVIPITLNN